MGYIRGQAPRWGGGQIQTQPKLWGEGTAGVATPPSYSIPERGLLPPTASRFGRPQPSGGYYTLLQPSNWRSVSYQPLLGKGLTRVAYLPRNINTMMPGGQPSEGQAVAAPTQPTQPVFTPQTYMMGQTKGGQPVYMQSVQGGGYQRVYSPERGSVIGPKMTARGTYDWSVLPRELQEQRQRWAVPQYGTTGQPGTWLNIK